MTAPPDRIWAERLPAMGSVENGRWADTVRYAYNGTEYIRLDLHTAALAAAEARGREQGLRVKPLEWEDHGAGQNVHLKAPTRFGTYYLEKYKDGLLYLWVPYCAGKRKVASVDAGKTEAQQDFAARILDAMIPAPKENPDE